MKTVHHKEIYGLEVNEHTGCRHYHSALDIVAIKFKCCHQYYCCYLCHLAIMDHPIQRWQKNDLNEKAILCGCCGIELTIDQYLSCQNKCPSCKSPFNPGCKLHWHIYFDY